MNPNINTDDIEYEELIPKLERKLAKLEVRRANLETEHAAVTAMLSNLRQLQSLNSDTSVNGMESKPSEHPARQTQKPSKILKGVSTSKAAKLFLSMTGQPLSNRELVDGMMERGYHTNSENPYTMVRSVLYRDRDAGTIIWRDNKWWLPEWVNGNLVASPQTATMETLSVESKADEVAE